MVDIEKSIITLLNDSAQSLKEIFDFDSIPPISFIETLDRLDVSNAVYDTIIALLEKKKKTSEIGEGPHIPILEDFIQNGLTIANDFCDAAAVGHIDIEQVDAIFRETLVEVMGNRFSA